MNKQLPNFYHQIPWTNCDHDLEVKYIVDMGRKRVDGEMKSPVKNKKRKTEPGKRMIFWVIVFLLIIVIVYLIVGLFELLLLSARVRRSLVEWKKGKIELGITDKLWLRKLYNVDCMGLQMIWGVFQVKVYAVQTPMLHVLKTLWSLISYERCKNFNYWIKKW